MGIKPDASGWAVWYKQDMHINQLFCFLQEFFKQPIIVLTVEHRHTAVDAIDDMIDFVSDVDAS